MDPTPVLDWTYSPYVAAFFAFREAGPAHEIDAVRLFAFNKPEWPSPVRPIAHLTNVAPHVTLLDPAPIENRRALPQQALAMITNLNAIEHYIRHQEKTNGRSFMTVIDLPWSERDKALKDLRYMGISAASMFPGLDGTCEDLRQELFG